MGNLKNPKMVTSSLRFGLLTFCLLLGPASTNASSERLLRSMSTHRPSSKMQQTPLEKSVSPQERTNELLEKSNRRLDKLVKSNAAMQAALDKFTLCIGSA